MSWNIRRNPFFPGQFERHDGIDLPYGMNEMVNAKQDGVIKRISNDPNGYGNFVDILHDDGTTGRYAHAGIISRGEGQRVKRGDEIGLAGSTGRSTGPHLHFEHHDQSGRPIDPRPLLASVGGRAPNQFATGTQAAPTQNNGGPNMATALPLATGAPPMGMEEYVRQAQSLIPQANPTPELLAMMQQNAQRRANNLPLAMGAMLSGDKGMSVLGGSMYKDGQEALNPQALGEEGFYDPNSGQFVRNPVGDVKRNQKMLELAVGLSQRAQSDAIRQEQTRTNQAFMQYIQSQGLINKWDQMSFQERQAEFTRWATTAGLVFQGQANARAQDGQNNGLMVPLNAPQTTQPDPLAAIGPMPPAPPPRVTPQFNPPGAGQAPVTSALPQATGQVPPPVVAQPPAQAAPPVVAQPPMPAPTNVAPPAAPVVNNAPAQAPDQMVMRQISDHVVEGFTVDTGEQIHRITKPGPYNGRMYVQRNGEFHPYDPAKGVIDDVTFRKETAAVKDTIAASAKLGGLVDKVLQNQGAFDLRNTAINTVLPNSMANRVTSMINTPESMQVRAQLLKDASEEMSRLFGAAQSLGEDARASEFLIKAGDGVETIINKLKGARDYAETLKLKHGPAFTRAANLQLTGGKSGTDSAPTVPPRETRSPSEILKSYGVQQ
jgi:hypothetical protein